MLPLEEISMSEPALKTAELRAEIALSFIVDEVLDVKEDAEIVATEDKSCPPSSRTSKLAKCGDPLLRLLLVCVEVDCFVANAPRNDGGII